jgi:hypothetical protein
MDKIKTWDLEQREQIEHELEFWITQDIVYNPFSSTLQAKNDKKVKNKRHSSPPPFL